MDVMLSSGAVSPRKPLSLRLTVLVLGAVAVVIIFLLWQNGSFKARDTVLISAGFPSQELYMLKHGNLKSVDVQVPGELEDYVKGKGGSAAIVRMDDGAFEVFLLSATPKQLTNDGMRKASLAMSPDGQWIAYATLTNLDVAETEKISSWTMYVLSVASAEATPLVSGYAPQFFMRDGVLTLFFTSPDGYMLADPVAKTTRTDSMQGEDDIQSVAVISDDGAYMVMKDAVADGYTVLEVQEVSPNFFIHPIGKISTPLTSVAIVGDMVMGLFGTPDASVLYAYTIANPKDGKKLSTLPARQSPYYLLP